MKVSELIEQLQKRNPNEIIASVIWSIGDVEQANASMAEDSENLTQAELITEAECIEVLSRAEYYNDDERGISWDTLQCYIDAVKKERTK